MQSVSSRIWTRVAVSIFYDDNQYTFLLYLLNFANVKISQELWIEKLKEKNSSSA